MDENYARHTELIDRIDLLTMEMQRVEAVMTALVGIVAIAADSVGYEAHLRVGEEFAAMQARLAELKEASN